MECGKLETFLIYMRGALFKLQKQCDNQMKEYGITNSHWVYLMILKRYPDGISMINLSKKTRTDKALASRIIKHLEDKGYVYRDTNDFHTRGYKIFVTKQGEQICEEIYSIIEKSRDGILAKFTEEEKKQIFATVEMVANRLDHKEEDISCYN